jgi:serine O-acetyltransferase
MGRAQRKTESDPIWDGIRAEVAADAEREPVLARFLGGAVLDHARLEDALAHLLASSLATPALPAHALRVVIDEAFAADPAIGAAVRADLRAVRERDPACSALSIPLLYFKGFHALEAWRVAHWLLVRGRGALALWLQNRISEVFGADIHPAARIGSGILIDHGTGVVIGETAVIEDDVSLLHEVTLGGTGKQTGDRHPKVRAGVLIGAGAKLLGNVVVGEGAKIGAGSVVLEDVAPHSTVAGVPARVVGREQAPKPALEMDHRLPDAKGDA